MIYGLPDIVTAQSLFDKGVMHLREQGEPGFGNGACRYRMDKYDKVLACIVGCLLPDDVAKSLANANPPVRRLLADLEGHDNWVASVTPHKALLMGMQIMHDRWQSHGLTMLLSDLRQLALKFMLDTAKVDEWRKEIKDIYTGEPNADF